MKRNTLLLVLVAVVVLIGLDVVAQTPAQVTRWPHTFTGADTTFTLPELQPVSFTADAIVPYFRTFTATGAYLLPGLSRYEFIADGAGVKLRFLNLTENSTAPDSLYIDSKGDATNIFCFGY